MIDFFRFRSLYVLFSMAILLGFVGMIFYRKNTRGSVFLYSVDYTGGAQVLLSLSKFVHGEEIAKKLEGAGFRGVVTRDLSNNEVLVRVPEHGGDLKGFAGRIKGAIEKSFKGLEVSIKQIDSVGVDASASLWKKSLLAVILGLIMMLLYTWLRFWSFSFGAGVLVALFHDFIVILMFFMMFNYEISSNVIAAILAILGYSINDTIVIFARIRENMGKIKGVDMREIVNLSINETLRRTLLTSFATALVVVSLLIFGGYVLRTLSIALLIGIIFGTYSSIAIASTVMLKLYGKKLYSR